MTERGILFSGAMVRALLDGTKTQTRRVCKSQPYSNGFHFDGREILCHNDYLPPSAMLMDYRDGGQTFTASNMEGWEFCCPYGQPGDGLWVRETWAQPAALDPGPTVYRADYPACVPAGFTNLPSTDEIRWKPSIHMPRAASRILLEITNVRAERLQDIGEADAIAEGIEQMPCAVPDTRMWRNYDPSNGWTSRVAIPQNSYRSLWDSINGPGSWAANPWVWVVEFKRVRP